jgi:phage I-like protein
MECMTDLEKLRMLFSEFGIGYMGEDDEGHKGVILRVPWKDHEREKIKIDGYDDFVTVFEFDDSGKFVKVNLWE